MKANYYEGIRTVNENLRTSFLGPSPGLRVLCDSRQNWGAQQAGENTVKCEEWLSNVQITVNEFVRAGNYGFQQSPEVLPEGMRGYTLWADGVGVKVVLSCDEEGSLPAEADVTITPQTDLKKLNEFVEEAFRKKKG
jgi:hypothetical protein